MERFIHHFTSGISRTGRWLLFPALLFLASCDLIDVHPYDGDIDGETGINARNIARIEETLKGRTQIRFAFISDTQRWYDETEDEVASINARGDIDFVIHGGDLTDFAVTKEFEWQQKILNKLTMPYVVLLGNHDCIGSGKEVYRCMFGNENFSFLAGPTRFICLDTNALEYDFSNPVPDLGYIESFRGDTSCKNTVIAMHVAPFQDEFNNNVAKAFNYEIALLNNPIFCINGHAHSNQVSDIYGNGLLYYQITCASDRQYYVFTVDEKGYTYETITF